MRDEPPIPAGAGPDDAQPSGRRTHVLVELVLTVAAAVTLALLTQQFLIKPFRIPSGSMENTLNCGARVLVDRLTYRFGEPERGDVVVFHPPAAVVNGEADPSQWYSSAESPQFPESPDPLVPAKDNFIKRLVGLPGDRWEMRKGVVFIDGEKLDEPYLNPERDTRSWGPVTIPKGRYLMLGDNRVHSQDGRFFGFVPRDFLVGQAFLIYWPPKDVGLLPDKEPLQPGVPQQPDPRCLQAGQAG